METKRLTTPLTREARLSALRLEADELELLRLCREASTVDAWRSESPPPAVSDAAYAAYLDGRF